MKLKRSIYADNAATTRLDPLALEAMLPFLRDSFFNPSAKYSQGRTARRAVEAAREQIAEGIGASPEEIVFTSSGTESDNWAIKETARSLSLCKKGKRLITSAIEHHAVLNSCKMLEREGFTTTQIPVDKQGRVSVDDVIAAITPKTTVVSVMLANNEIGTVQDVASIASIAHSHGLVCHTDAVQAVGHIPIDVRKLGVDLLSASAHKFNGPKGVGFLYKRSGIRLLPFLDGGRQENGYRAGTENVAGIIGMACALSNHLARLSQNIQKLQRMEELIEARISRAIPDARFNGAPDEHLPGLISLSIPHVPGEGLLYLLELKGIFVSTGAACNSRDTVVSHVLRAIGQPKSIAKGTIRISLSRDNTDADAIIIADTIVNLYSKCLLIQTST